MKGKIVADFEDELNFAKGWVDREIENAGMPGILGSSLREAIEHLIDLRVTSIIAESSWSGAQLVGIGSVREPKSPPPLVEIKT